MSVDIDHDEVCSMCPARGSYYDCEEHQQKGECPLYDPASGDIDCERWG